MAKRAKKTQQNKPARKEAEHGAQGVKKDWPRAWFAAAVLAIFMGAVYGRAFDVPFIFDDHIAIIKNTSIVSLWPPVGSAKHRGPLNPAPDLPTSSRPLVNLSFALNYRVGGLNPTGYHAVNLLIHFGSAMLLWAITRRSLRLPFFSDRFAASAGWLALFVALLWALHPLQTESVIYVTQRTELMMAFFYLATLYCSLRYWEAGLPTEVNAKSHPLRAAESRSPQRAVWLSLATLACLGGMTSKEVMVSAPLIVLLFERTFVAGSLAIALRRSWPLYLGLACTWILLLGLIYANPRSNSAGFGLGVSAYAWWLTQAKVLLMYFKLVVWPWPLLIHYELPYLHTFADAWKYVVPVLMLGTITLVLLWRNHPIGFLGTWIFAILSPTSIIPIITEMAAERRMYLPLAALIVLLVVGGYMFYRLLSGRWKRSRQVPFGSDVPLAAIAASTLLFALAWGLLSLNRLEAYRDALGLWQDVLRLQPHNSVAHQNAGYTLREMGRVSAAIEHYREAVRLAPNSAEAHYSLAVLLSKTGAHGDAAPHFAEASRIRPTDLPARINLAAALIEAGRYDESIKASRAALELTRDHWAVYNNLGLALQKAGKYPDAIDSLQQALRLNPNALDLYNDIADTYLLDTQPTKALSTLEAGLEVAHSARDTVNMEKFSARLNEIRKSKRP
jgi:Flp pilus assembly protein TadD